MSTFSKCWVTCAIAALAGVIWMGTPEPAQAQFGVSFGGLPFRIHIGPGWGGRYGRRHHRRGAARAEKSDSEETGAPSKEKSDKVLASLGAPSSAQQSAVLKSISASPVLGVVGSTKDLQDIGKPTSKEEDRDYTGSLDKIINKLAGAQDKGLATPGDVTASGIEAIGLPWDVWTRSVNCGEPSSCLTHSEPSYLDPGSRNMRPCRMPARPC